jgi:serine/threonine protein phosphatase PrpC
MASQTIRMTDKQARDRLKALYEECKELRAALGIEGTPGETTWQAELDDRKLIVVADGHGGARLMLVEGSNPMDYRMIEERKCATENSAENAASRLLRAWSGEENDEGVIEKYDCVKDEIFGKVKA